MAAILVIKLASLMYQIIWYNYACSVHHPYSHLTHHFFQRHSCFCLSTTHLHAHQHHTPLFTLTLTHTHALFRAPLHSPPTLLAPTSHIHPPQTLTTTTPLKHPPHNTDPHRPLSMQRQPIARRARDWKGENEKEPQVSTYALSCSPIFQSYTPILRSYRFNVLVTWNCATC